jgi:putative SOS response-associated peptidase YedK
MCGRFRLSRIDRYVLEEKFGASIEAELLPHYNIAPTQTVAVVRMRDDQRVIAGQRWGLIPNWSKDAKAGFSLINARSEEVFEKPAYAEPFRKRRCLVIADGFYEWKKVGAGKKQPYCFTLKDDSAFAFAGIWDSWKSPERMAIESCSILTTSPNALCAQVHDRMPVIMEPRHYEAWLTAPATEAKNLQELLIPFEAERMKKYAVNPLVNSPKNDSPQVMEPFQPPQASLADWLG